MLISEMPQHDLRGCRVIPDLNALRQHYCTSMGRQGGNTTIDKLPVSGWQIVFDLRQDGLADGFVCERPKSDGSVDSVVWEATHIRRVFPNAPR